jgi:hypothetical protein
VSDNLRSGPTVGEGPIDPETGLPKFTYTETRTHEHKFGEPPIATRTIKAVEEIFEGGGGSSSDIAAVLAVAKGSPHPDFPGLQCIEKNSTETVETSNASLKKITEITSVYSVVQKDDENPLTEPDIWTFQTQGAAIAALYYIDGNTIKPLTNSAGDYIKGLEVDEAQTKLTVKGNRASFPSATATALTNCVNSGAFLGGSAHSWKCQGITGSLKYETVNDIVIQYWEVTVELLYRQTGWNLRLPDIGFNFIEGGVKKRAMVFDDQNKEWVASADPVALNGTGGLAGNDPPAVLERRLYRAVDFSAYFGSPPS